MRFQGWIHTLIVVGIAALAGVSAGSALAAEPDWKAGEQALGKSGQLQPGDVFRIAMPRATSRSP